MNSDEFRKINYAEDEGHFPWPLSSSATYRQGTGKMDPVLTQKKYYGDVQHTETHHKNCMDLDGNIWTMLTATKDMYSYPGIGSGRKNDLDGSKLEDSAKVANQADASRRPTTEKPWGGQKKWDVNRSHLIYQELLIFEETGFDLKVNLWFALEQLWDSIGMPVPFK